MSSKRASPKRRMRSPTPPPSRAKNTGGRKQYERNAFVEFAKGYLAGEQAAGRSITYRTVLTSEAKAQWNKKHARRRPRDDE